MGPEHPSTGSPPTRGGRCRLALVLGVLSLWLAGCASSPVGSHREHPPALEGFATVELVGALRGPVSGFGSKAEVHAFLRGDGVVRADIRSTEAGGTPVHEVLVWASDVALLFDRRTGRFTDLGEQPGELEAWGGSFRSVDALWLAGGRRPGSPSSPAEWSRRGDEWRGRRDDLGLRRPVREPLLWSEVVWRDPDGGVHRLRADVEGYADVGGRAWPSRLGVEGTELDARVVVDWEEVRWHSALGDSILDPLWEPPRP